MGFVRHDNINPKYHCTHSGLHLKDSGNDVLTKKFKKFICNIDKENWRTHGKSILSLSNGTDSNLNTEVFANGHKTLISDPKGKNAFDHVSSLKRLHTKNVFLGHLNIISLRNKFESIQLLIKNNFDIFLYNGGDFKWWK